MTSDDLLRTMRDALEQERDAIRRLDSEGVIRASAVKEKVLAKVLEAPASERPALVSALGGLKSELRQNLLLLAHARDAVRQALAHIGDRGRPRLQVNL